MADEQYEILIEELDEAACWRLVSREAFGRIGFVHGGEVMVLPVNAVVMGNRVVFRTADETMVALAGNGSVVAFQSDCADRITETGWSVLVHGRLWDITDAPETASFHKLSVRPWVPGPRNRWMSIEPTAVTGRTIHRNRIVSSRSRSQYTTID